MTAVRSNPRPRLEAERLYDDGTGRIHCGRLHCAGASAHLTGRSIAGAAVKAITVREAATFRDIIGRSPACEECGQQFDTKGTDMIKKPSEKKPKAEKASVLTPRDLIKREGLRHVTAIEEPDKDRRKAWGLRTVVKDTRWTIFRDNEGNYVRRRNSAIFRHGDGWPWHLLTKAAVGDDLPAGFLLMGRYALASPPPAPASTSAPTDASSPEQVEVPAPAPVKRARKAPAATPAATADGALTTRRAPHPRVFGKHSYCSTSRALGLLGWRADEATAVFAELGIVPRHAGSVSATLCDKRATPADLSADEVEQLEAMRVRARAILDAAAPPASVVEEAPAKPARKPRRVTKAKARPRRAARA